MYNYFICHGLVCMQYFNGNIIAVTGSIGAGKSLYVVSGLKQLKAENDAKPAEQQRQFYSDISGLKIDGFLPAPDDWRTVPHGSVIVYDECQLNDLFTPDGKAVSPHQQVIELTLARRLGYTIIFIAQSPRFLHPTIRAVANQHIHLERQEGFERSTVLPYPKVVLNPAGVSNMQKCAGKFSWNFEKENYALYDSLIGDNASVEHQQKGQIPAIVKRVMTGLFLVAVLIGYFAFSYFFDDKKSSDKSLSETVSDTLSVSAPASAPAYTDISKAKFSTFLDDECVLFDEKANIITVDDITCKRFLLPSPDYKATYRLAVDSINAKIDTKKTYSLDFHKPKAVSYSDYQNSF